MCCLKLDTNFSWILHDSSNDCNVHIDFQTILKISQTFREKFCNNKWTQTERIFSPKILNSDCTANKRTRLKIATYPQISSLFSFLFKHRLGIHVVCSSCIFIFILFFSIKPSLICLSRIIKYKWHSFDNIIVIASSVYLYTYLEEIKKCVSPTSMMR